MDTIWNKLSKIFSTNKKKCRIRLLILNISNLFLLSIILIRLLKSLILFNYLKRGLSLWLNTKQNNMKEKNIVKRAKLKKQLTSKQKLAFNLSRSSNRQISVAYRVIFWLILLWPSFRRQPKILKTSPPCFLLNIFKMSLNFPCIYILCSSKILIKRLKMRKSSNNAKITNELKKILEFFLVKYVGIQPI